MVSVQCLANAGRSFERPASPIPIGRKHVCASKFGLFLGDFPPALKTSPDSSYCCQ